MVTELGKARYLMYVDNLPEDSLWIHADKGGKSTQLILQVINQNDRHSINYELELELERPPGSTPLYTSLQSFAISTSCKHTTGYNFCMDLSY